MSVVNPKLSEYRVEVFSDGRSVAFASENGEIPEDLADENILKSSPFFVVVSRSAETAAALASRLEALFPESPAVISVTQNSVLQKGKTVATAGAAVFADDFEQFRFAIPWTLASSEDLKVSTSFNKVANRQLFWTTLERPREKTIVAPPSRLALFSLGPAKTLPIFPGSRAQFFIFENRYKLMIKECAEQNVPLVLSYDDASVICDLVDYRRHDDSGACTVVLRVASRATVRTVHPPSPHEFSLNRATVEPLFDTKIDTSLDHLLDHFTLKFFKARYYPFTQEQQQQPPLDDEQQSDQESPEALSFRIAAVVDQICDVDYHTKLFWFDTTDTASRLASLIQYVEKHILKLQDDTTTVNTETDNDTSTTHPPPH